MAVTIGVRDLTFFPLVKDDKTKIEYGEAIKLAPLMKISLNAKLAEASLYGDDKMTEYVSELTGFDISFDMNYITPDQEVSLLGYKKGANGIVSSSVNTVAPYGALAFKSKQTDGTYKHVVLYKVKLVPVNEEFETKGENLQFKTPTVVGKAIPRVNDDEIRGVALEKDPKASAVIPKWFEYPQTTGTGATSKL